MIQKAILITALTLAMLATKAHAQTGTWRNYLAYNDITDVQQAGNTLFVLASEALYSYNTTDQSITTYDKTNGLSDCGIQHIAWCADASRLMAVYENGNIDLVSRDGQTENMPEYYNYSTTLDKTVYGLDVIGSHAYMSTGFGIVNINVADAEVTETYNLGFRVDYVYADDTRIYAASSTNGTYSAPLTANLLDPGNWTYTAPYTPRQKTIDPDLLATAQTLKPGGPRRNWFTFMKFEHDRLYTCGGYFISGYVQENRQGTIQILEGDEWTIYPDNINETTGYSYMDINCLAADPNDPNHIFAGGRCGLYEFQDGQLINYFNKDNSPLRGAMSNGNELDNTYVLVNGLAFHGGNLWALNSQTENTSIMEYNGSEFISHHKQELMFSGMSFQTMQGLINDSRGLMWFVNINGWQHPAIVCYQQETDQINVYDQNFYNQNGTPINMTYLNCIAEDKDGNMWIGTDVGPFYLSPSNMDNTDQCILTQFIVPRNDGTDYGDYLLSGIHITCIAIDGAGRKWFGTNDSGVYLVSEDNVEQIEHFTSENSPLLSNEIRSIAINGNTGEVFFGTEKGLCSYMSNATEPSTEMTKDNVYAYPNPVRPDYTGPITIVGLTYDADVKITTSNGVLVNQGRSTGGTYQWDGCDLEGRRVASGVYMVQTATSSGDKGTVCKIGIVR